MLSANYTSGTQVNFMDLVSLMADPEKFRQRTEELQAHQAALDEKIALAGVADEILTIRANIDEFLFAAQAERDLATQECNALREAADTELGYAKARASADLAAARAKAKEIIAKAEVSAQTIVDKAANDAKNAEIEIETIKGSLTEQKNVLSARDIKQDRRAEALDAEFSKLQALREELTTLEAQLREEQARLDQRYAKLKEAWDNFLAQVG